MPPRLKTDRKMQYLERNQFIATIVFPEQEMKCASMKIKDFSGVRRQGGVMGKINKAITTKARASAKEAMLVLKLFDGALHVEVCGEIKYRECSRPGEIMKLAAKGMSPWVILITTSPTSEFLAYILFFLLVISG